MQHMAQSLSVGYASESCAWCNGRGDNLGSICAACDGKGKVLVRQPAKKCPMCGGDGKNATTLFSGQLCVLCGGRGWALALKE
jgi:hypothetical protein